MRVTNRHTYTSNKSRLGSESFTGWLGNESNILVPPPPLSAKSSNEFYYSSYGSPIGVLKLEAQTNKVSFIGPCHLPVILGQKGKSNH